MFIAPDLAMMSRAFAEAAQVSSAGRSWQVGQPTAIDPTRAPPQQTCVVVQVVVSRAIAGDALAGFR
jgi:phytoene dehydrogenase-like protein